VNWKLIDDTCLSPHGQQKYPVSAARFVDRPDSLIGMGINSLSNWV
jgi:hypothetical protein